MKKILSMILALAMVLALCACGVAPAAPAEEAAPSEPVANMVNPVHESTAGDILSTLGFDMSSVAGYENVRYAIIDGNPSLAQAVFTLNGDEYCYRIAAAPSEMAIDGMYYSWFSSENVEVGHCIATLNLTSEGQGVISWFDVVPGIMYALSMSSGATADKLTAAATAIFAPMQGEASGDFEAAYIAVLEEALASFRPGTAGSSLTGVACAAQLADVFTQYGPSAEEVASVTARAINGKADASVQLSGLVSSYNSIAADGSVLDGCGYESVCYPWDGEALAPLFEAVNAAASRAAYASVLQLYASAFEAGWDRQSCIDNGVNYLIVDTTAAETGFLTADLDGDGTAELLVGSQVSDNPYLGKMIFDLYTLDEMGAPKSVYSSGERDRLYYAGGDLFAHNGSSGAADSFDTTEQYKDGALTDLGYVTDPADYVQAELTLFSEYNG